MKTVIHLISPVFYGSRSRDQNHETDAVHGNAMKTTKLVADQIYSHLSSSEPKDMWRNL
jgi:hypothetical protein